MGGFQLLCAQILSTAYAMIMMAVIVGTALQLGEDGIGSPSAIFLISLSSSFFIAACLHPQEFWCIVPGIIYLLSIPSMYLLLILYSIINLNVVSWGTREVQTKKTKKVRQSRSFFFYLFFIFGTGGIKCEYISGERGFGKVKVQAPRFVVPIVFFLEYKNEIFNITKLRNI